MFQVQTTKNLDGQSEILTWLPVGQAFIFPYFEHCLLSTVKRIVFLILQGARQETEN